MIMEPDAIGRLVGGARRSAPANLGYTGQFLEGVKGLQVPANHTYAEVVAGNSPVAARETESSEAVIQGCSAIVAERMDGPSGKHDVLTEIDPIIFSLFGAHGYTRKLSMACRVSE
jgi:hypothetical protein